MTNYYSHQMENIQSMYSDACIWFDSLGFSYAKTRYGIYKNIFSEFLRRCDERDFSGDIEELKKILTMRTLKFMRQSEYTMV